MATQYALNLAGCHLLNATMTRVKRELTAVMHALIVWRCYLDGSDFTIYSDHEPLRCLSTKTTLSPRQVRWSQFLERFN